MNWKNNFLTYFRYFFRKNEQNQYHTNIYVYILIIDRQTIYCFSLFKISDSKKKEKNSLLFIYLIGLPIFNYINIKNLYFGIPVIYFILRLSLFSTQKIFEYEIYFNTVVWL